MRKLVWTILPLLFFSCHKNNTDSGCGIQACTGDAVWISVTFKDKTGQQIVVKNFVATDLRTNAVLQPSSPPAIPEPNGYILPNYIASDSIIGQFSTDGDDVQVTATNPSTSEVISVRYKISGGCNCHVAKLSGPAVIQFTQ